MKRWWIALLVCGCYSPSLHDGQFTCERTSACPSGYRCICQVCRKSGEAAECDAGVADLSAADGAEAHDLALSDLSSHDLAAAHDLASASSGCSAGARSPADPGLLKVALCPGAWTVPGLRTTTPCSRVVGANGKNGATACSSEDNCATGWHTCNDEGDLSSRGFTATDCITLGGTGANALWLTRQLGAPPSPGPSPGPPQCTGSMAGPVFGCGGYGMPPDSSTCHLLQRVLVNGMGGQDLCSQSTNGAFSCGTAMGAEANDVVKTVRDSGGGIFCCAN